MNKHDWLLNEDKTININYLNYNTHNGPFCKVCRKFFCLHCDKIENLVCEKDLNEWKDKYYQALQELIRVKAELEGTLLKLTHIEIHSNED